MTARQAPLFTAWQKEEAGRPEWRGSRPEISKKYHQSRPTSVMLSNLTLTVYYEGFETSSDIRPGISLVQPWPKSRITWGPARHQQEKIFLQCGLPPTLFDDCISVLFEKVVDLFPSSVLACR
jgi:hypothetical protein